ncbi:MAG TPA: acyltransferase [Rhizomicrobium sp.]|nr:acyltransferase [Rhizomicrobium sp.]
MAQAGARGVPAFLRSWFRAPSRLHLDDPSSRDGLVPSLNGLRATSVMLVLVTHTLGHAGLGNFGVLVFFVISGFLITRLFLAERKRSGAISLGGFYARRAIRLYPAILAYTLLVVVAYATWAPARFDVAQPACALLYCENYLVTHREAFGPAITMPFAHFWSLSIEEHFYIVFPALLLLALWLSRGRMKGVVWLGAAASVIPLLLRLLYVWLWPELLSPRFGHYIYSRTETRFDAIAAGILIAAACETARGRAALRWLATPFPAALALATLVAWPFVNNPFFRETIGYTILDAAAAVLLCATVFTARYRPLNTLLNLRAVDWIGRLSYSIYVWHYGILDLSFRFLPANDRWQRFLVVALLTPLVASASYYGPEAWARQWRARRPRLVLQTSGIEDGAPGRT